MDIAQQCCLLLHKRLEHLLLTIHPFGVHLYMSVGLFALAELLFDFTLHAKEGIFENVDVLSHSCFFFFALS